MRCCTLKMKTLETVHSTCSADRKGETLGGSIGECIKLIITQLAQHQDLAGTYPLSKGFVV